MLLDASVREALARSIEQLRTLGQGVAWVTEANLHVTLKFLGAVDEGRLDDVRAALDRAVAGTKPFGLAVVGLGAFPSRSRPRVIWAGVGAGVEALTPLAARVETELEELGFPCEERAFSPHVTLGRVREPRRDPRLEAALAGGAGECFGAIRVEAISLMRSDLSPRGARHTELAAHRLA